MRTLLKLEQTARVDTVGGARSSRSSVGGVGTNRPVESRLLALPMDMSARDALRLWLDAGGETSDAKLLRAMGDRYEILRAHETEGRPIRPVFYESAGARTRDRLLAVTQRSCPGGKGDRS